MRNKERRNRRRRYVCVRRNCLILSGGYISGQMKGRRYDSVRGGLYGRGGRTREITARVLKKKKKRTYVDGRLVN